jgi:hypothetical protein
VLAEIHGATATATVPPDRRASLGFAAGAVTIP